MGPYMEGKADTIHADDTVTGWEFIGRQALRKGNMKIVRLPQPWGDNEWALHDLSKDPGEEVNLHSEKPEVFDDLMQEWEKFAKENKMVEIGNNTPIFSLDSAIQDTEDEDEDVS